MWRRTYLFLVLVRLWFALSPSYLHPDENFQGPEVIAGMFVCLPYNFPRLGFWRVDTGMVEGVVLCFFSPLTLAVCARPKANLEKLYGRPSRSYGAMLTLLAFQDRSSTIPSGTHGNSQTSTRYAAFSHYGPYTGCRCFFSAGYG